MATYLECKQLLTGLSKYHADGTGDDALTTVIANDAM